jgi:GNAT superfamily N-acetyltransferase
MQHEILIRDATPDDARALARIHMDSRASAMPWLAITHSDAETEGWMATEVIPHQRIRVATLNGLPVGFCAYANGWMEQLYILPAHQNAGIGSRLFNDICTVASGRFQFWVFQRNTAARRFYERRGGRLLKWTDGKDNQEREPDALYEKCISQP